MDESLAEEAFGRAAGLIHDDLKKVMDQGGCLDEIVGYANGLACQTASIYARLVSGLRADERDIASVAEAGLEAMELEIRRINQARSKPIPFEGVPSFFRACCREARSGGSLSYAHAGRELARHVEDLIPYDADPDQWAAEVEFLEEVIAGRQDDAVWDWFQTRYPRCMRLVPNRRREAFLAGVYDLHE